MLTISGGVFVPDRPAARRRTRIRRRARARSGAAQRPHLLDELIALALHLLEYGSIVRHDLRRRALDVLRVVEPTLARRNLIADSATSPRRRAHSFSTSISPASGTMTSAPPGSTACAAAPDGAVSTNCTSERDRRPIVRIRHRTTRRRPVTRRWTHEDVDHLSRRHRVVTANLSHGQHASRTSSNSVAARDSVSRARSARTRAREIHPWPGQATVARTLRSRTAPRDAASEARVERVHEHGARDVSIPARHLEPGFHRL